LLLLCLSFTVTGQTILGEIAVTGKVEDIQVFPYGDSTFVAVQRKAQDNATQPQVFWIYNGQVTQQPAPFGSEDKMLALTKFKGRPCFYIAASSGKTADIQAISIDGIHTLLYAGDFDGKITGVFHDEQLLIATINNRKDKLDIFEIEGLQVVGQKSFVTQYNIRGSLPVAIGKTDWTSIEKGMSLAKLYKYGNKLSLIIDDNQYSPMESSTTIIEFHLSTGKTEERRIPAKGMQLFRSCLYGDKLYRFSIHRDMIYLSMNDVHTGKLLAAKKMYNEKDFRNVTITSRSTITEIQHDNTLHAMIRSAQDCLPSISAVHSGADTTNIELMIGTYSTHENLNMIYPAAGIMGGAIGGGVAAISIRAITMARGQYRYFFARPNSKHEFDFVAEADSRSANARIDHYELIQKEHYATRFDVKDYLRTPDGAIGLYYSIKTNTISVVKFGTEIE